MLKIKKTNALTALIHATILMLSNPAAAVADPLKDVNFEQIEDFLGVMQSFFGLVKTVHEISEDPEKSAVLQMFKIQELYEKKGNKAKAIPVFKGVIKDTKSVAIRNAAYWLIGETLKEAGEHDRAIDEFKDALRLNLEKAI